MGIPHGETHIGSLIAEPIAQEFKYLGLTLLMDRVMHKENMSDVGFE